MRNHLRRLTRRLTLACLTLMLVLPAPLMAAQNTTTNSNKMPNIKPWWDNPLIKNYIVPWAGLFLAVIVVLCFGGVYVMFLKAINAHSRGRSSFGYVVSALMFIALAVFALKGLSSVYSFSWLVGG